MERKLGLERVYKLGEYKTVRFLDEISNIPNKLALNHDLIEKIRYLQLVNVEAHYRKYYQLLEKVNAENDYEVALEMLELEYQSTLDEIKDLLTEKEGE